MEASPQARASLLEKIVECGSIGTTGRVFVLQLPELTLGLNAMRFLRETNKIKPQVFGPTLVSGLLLQELQEQVPEHPLWKSHLPDLTIKVEEIDGKKKEKAHLH